MPQGLKVQTYKRYLIPGIIILILVSTLGIWIAPRLLGLYYQVKGGTLLEQAVVDAGVDLSSAIPCSVQPLPDSSSTRVVQAVQQLQTALAYTPRLAQASLLLGRAECLLGEPISAVQSYRNYVQLRPENPLGHLELGFAYANLCNSRKGTPSEEPKPVQCDKEISANVLRELYAANIDPKQFLASADNEYQQQRWTQALNFYLLNDKFGQPVSSEAKFREEIATIASNPSQDPQREPPALLTTHTLTDSLQIKAENLQWIYDATPLLLHPGGDPSIGVLWWNSDAITGVKVLDSREYELTVSAQNTPPAPVRFQIVVDFQPAATFELSRDDMSWQEFYTNVHLDAGFHTIGIRFLNDGFVNGLDRNLYIDWLRVQMKPK